jgi:outer membrane murein-binding lipoprotein Lpp
MKKILYTFVLGSSLLFVGCSNSTSTTSKDVKPAKSEKIDKSSFQHYTDSLNTKLDVVTNDVNSINKLVNEADNNSLILHDSEFLSDIESNCNKLRHDIKNFTLLDTAVIDKKAYPINDIVLKFANELEFVADNLPYAIREDNSYLISECSAHFKKSGDYMSLLSYKLENSKK